MKQHQPPTRRGFFGLTLAILLFSQLLEPPPAGADKKKDPSSQKDPYATVVFPPPPDEARIKLEHVLAGRVDVQGGRSKWKKALIGASPLSEFDRFNQPVGIAFDPNGRILVTDVDSGAIIRMDVEEQLYDVLGTRSSPSLQKPFGISVGSKGTILVTDLSLKLVIAFDENGSVTATYGGEKSVEFVNPTDVVFSPDRTEIFVADSRAHQIFVLSTASGLLERTIGENGSGPGQFAFPTSLSFGPEGNLYVVDQLNSRVQLLEPSGEFLDEFGSLGTGFGSFVRPKHVAVDEVGLIYVTDAAFNNVQLFDIDFSLLTFLGEGGTSPGRFQGVAGIDVQGDYIGVADPLNRRVQIFRFIMSKTAG